MDPTQALLDIRGHISEFRTTREELPADEFGDLVTKVEDLDEWMSKGGFPPEQWRPHVGRPRRTEDGFVLEGVEHGKRSSYNKGCRCVPCTEANRSAGARQRARAKERP